MSERYVIGEMFNFTGSRPGHRYFVDLDVITYEAVYKKDDQWLHYTVVTEKVTGECKEMRIRVIDSYEADEILSKFISEYQHAQ